MFYPLDPEVGIVQAVGPEILSDRLSGKSALVVGGTAGIGRGIALALAEAGAGVVIAGRSATRGAEVVARMTGVAGHPVTEGVALTAEHAEQHFDAMQADLSTVGGCVELAAKLKSSSWRFDFLVFTLGIWPDKVEPRTADGVDKVLALDVLARYVITQEVLPILAPGARVMSVLGSTAKAPPPPSVDTIKGLMTGDKASYFTPQMLGAAGVVMDAWLQEAVARSPGLSFVGTFPGIVATDLVMTSKTFPSCLRPLLAFGQRLVALSPEECGRRHVQILTSPNVGRRPVSYFNVLRLEGRQVNPLAYDADFRQWVWSHLEQTLARLR